MIFHVVAGLVPVWRLLPGSPHSCSERVMLKTCATLCDIARYCETGGKTCRLLPNSFNTLGDGQDLHIVPTLLGPAAHTLKPVRHCRTTQDDPREFAAMMLTGVPRKLNSSQTSSSSSCLSSSSVQPSSMAVETKWPHVLMSC